MKQGCGSCKTVARRWLWTVALAGMCLAAAPRAEASRYIATPNAWTIPEGRLTVWLFGIYEARTTDDWRRLNRVDVGLRDQLELGIFVVDPPGAASSTWINLQYRVLEEDVGRPSVSVGVWDAAERDSWFASVGKTYRLSEDGTGPQYLKLSGALGSDRLRGGFGGLDFRFAPVNGLHLEYAPTSLRLPETDGWDVGVYHWLSPTWRLRASRVGGNPMVDVIWAGWIGK